MTPPRGFIGIKDGKIVDLSDRDCIARLSVINTQVVDVLRTLSEGEIITWQELAEKVGEDIRHCPHQYGRAARLFLERYGVYFSVITGKGLQRLTPEEIALAAPAKVRLLGKRAHQEVSRLTYIPDFDKISEVAKAKYRMATSLLNVMDLMAKPKVMEMTIKRAAIQNSTLPTSDLLEAIMTIT